MGKSPLGNKHLRESTACSPRNPPSALFRQRISSPPRVFSLFFLFSPFSFQNQAPAGEALRRFRRSLSRRILAARFSITCLAGYSFLPSFRTPYTRTGTRTCTGRCRERRATPSGRERLNFQRRFNARRFVRLQFVQLL